eukprot:m.17986 g.17986  ORF g.17986 m.17986 type:complete len:52 (+) comp29808_c0_seq2:559-714(+)
MNQFRASDMDASPHEYLSIRSFGESSSRRADYLELETAQALRSEEMNATFS